MNTYTVSPESFVAFKRKTIRIYSVFIAIAILGICYVFPFRDKIGILAIAFASTFLLLIATISTKLGLKRLQEVWSTYTLTINDDYILKTQCNHADIKIYKDEINKIQKSFGGDIVVKGGDWRRFIVIPSSLNGLDDVKSLLTQWQQIKEPSIKTLTLSLLIVVTILLGSFSLVRYYFYLKPNVLSIKITIFIALLISLILLWLFRSLPQIDERSKPKRWIFILMLVYLIYLAISIALSLFFKTASGV